jgi:hypothetical protein
MYLHAFTLSLFGKTIFITRATSAVIGLLGAALLGLSLKKVFQARYWWASVLILSAMPAWFLHSRTAFETAMTAAFYACFLLFYLLYRTQNPKYIYATLVFAAITFYTYSNAQATMAVAALFLLLSDLRYHWSQRLVIARSLPLVAVLALPFINFQLARPAGITEHLKMVGSFWYQDIPLQEKILLYLKEYAYGLSPQYWFFSNSTDLVRHQMDHLGHISAIWLPFFLGGILVCLRRFRQPHYRAVLLAALAVPAGGATVEIGITRVLAFVMPAALLITIGLEWLLERLKRWLPGAGASLLLFALLGWGSIALLRTALVDGPLWSRDYGLYGMQWGAKQVFVDTIPELLRTHPQGRILVSSTWANGADNFLHFFFTPEEKQRVFMDGIENYLFERRTLGEQDIFVMTGYEYEKALASPKLQIVNVERIIAYPDGSPGFHFVRLKYSQQVDNLFAMEKEARRQLVETQVEIDGELVTLRHSQIDMGEPKLMFDGDDFTLMRGMEANPFVIELAFPTSRSISKLRADFGLMSSKVTVLLYPADDGEPALYEQTFRRDSGDPWIQIDFLQAPGQVSKVRLDILNIYAGETTNVHIREIQFER